MGVVDSLILLAGLGGMMYYMTYYILPQLGSMQQAYAQQPQYIPQQQAPAPEPTIPEEPVDTAALELPPNGSEIENEAAAESEEQALELPEGGSEIENEADEDEEESEDERREREEEELKEEHEEQKKRRKEYDEETDPKKDTRYKGMSSREAGRAAARALGLQHFVYADVSRPYKIRGYYFDRTGNLIRYRF